MVKGRKGEGNMFFWAKLINKYFAFVASHSCAAEYRSSIKHFLFRFYYCWKKLRT